MTSKERNKLKEYEQQIESLEAINDYLKTEIKEIDKLLIETLNEASKLCGMVDSLLVENGYDKKNANEEKKKTFNDIIAKLKNSHE